MVFTVSDFARLIDRTLSTYTPMAEYFVLAKRSTAEPFLVIELDDSSHQTEKQQRKDAFQDEAFKSANLPTMRTKAKRSYSPIDISNEIRAALKKQA